MTNPDLTTVNDVSNPDRVTPSKRAGGKLDGEELAVTFPKLSWNVVRLALSRPS